MFDKKTQKNSGKMDTKKNLQVKRPMRSEVMLLDGNRIPHRIPWRCDHT